MKVAIDYDKNYEVKPELFDYIASRFQQAGHQVGMLTARAEDEGCPVGFRPDFIEFLDIGHLSYVDRASEKVKKMKLLSIDIIFDDRAELFSKEVVALNLT